MLVSEAQIQPTHKSMRLDMGKEGVVVVIYAFTIPFTHDDLVYFCKESTSIKFMLSYCVHLCTYRINLYSETNTTGQY